MALSLSLLAACIRYSRLPSTILPIFVDSIRKIGPLSTILPVFVDGIRKIGLPSTILPVFVDGPDLSERTVHHDPGYQSFLRLAALYWLGVVPV